MKCIKITHPDLNKTDLGKDLKTEYYFCHFENYSDIKNFTATCPWCSILTDIDGEGPCKDGADINGITIFPPESCVIKRVFGEGFGDDSEHYSECYYEKLSPEYFKRDLASKLEVWGSVMEQARAFF